MAEPITISIVVSNYNYGRFLPQCLDALRAQTYPHVECIVVDDGSTDDSRTIIARYPEFQGIFKANAGQAKALETGFRASRGDVVLFLDADDYLFPEACAEIARQWVPGLVSLHYRLQILEGDRLTDRTWPQDHFRDGAETIDCLFRLGYVPAAPTSGNAYARAYAAVIFDEVAALPIRWLDSCFAYAAPCAGVTRSTEQALGVYRIHDANLTGWTRRQTIGYVRKSLFTSFQAQRIARRLAARRNIPLPRWEFLNGPYDLKLHLLTRGGPAFPNDLPPHRALACASQSARGFLRMPGVPRLRRLANVALVFGFAVSPFKLRRAIAERFYNVDFAH
ncbi:glycosyltransferase [Lichenihabitans sp. Uapishka_5]|uniref:glycosyltransferase family 2 protein n=1 Tax=Lichenihabitans sp. Uapishka_5 TaxID=3037302 RepID=UPI0029E7F0BC|nr:glycosyltransferase [Lichenihabitans sp. Uapishka_5]MDX7953201.1 glycosyltransferase [Lichenihabitans sp. Uapishka_5]